MLAQAPCAAAQDVRGSLLPLAWSRGRSIRLCARLIPARMPNAYSAARHLLAAGVPCR
ncbi:hypothetical protein [Deinococcus sp. S9]|uniref:hypothetical protein n=1 Tax=Deinococcus sp. S9 TaxID=2545754 RepID=UPI000323A40A|nr:hypothetical protein [Deinococcus sp. S9]